MESEVAGDAPQFSDVDGAAPPSGPPTRAPTLLHARPVGRPNARRGRGAAQTPRKRAPTRGPPCGEAIPEGRGGATPCPAAEAWDGGGGGRGWGGGLGVDVVPVRLTWEDKV